MATSDFAIDQVPDGLPDALREVRLRSRRTLHFQERLVKCVLVGCGAVSVLVTTAIVVILSVEAVQFFQMPEVTVSDFLTDTQWSFLLGSEKHFGIWPLVSGTMLVTVVAMAVALPLGLITAVYLSEYAPPRLRSILKPTLEVLAGIPTVVYGFFALTAITPALQFLHEGFQGYNVLAGGLAVGILCLPTVSSLAEDALRAVPRSLREGAFGLGGTRFDVSLKVVLPAALSGIISAFLLAIARAVGETMIVALAVGSRPKLTIDPRESAQTMTGFMVQMIGGDVSNFGVEYRSLYAVAAVLFFVTLALTAVGHLIRKRFREVYE